jgi:hypothetical protein
MHWLLPLALFGHSGCELADDVVARRVSSPSAGSGAAATGGTTMGGSASGGQSGSSGSDTICDANRSKVPVVPSTSGALTRCSGWAARRSFAHALCSCGAVVAPHAFTTESFDSGTGESLRGGAAAGINGEYAGSVYVRVDGSLTVAGSTPLETGVLGLDIVGDLRLRAAANTLGPISVGRDVWLLGVASSSTARVGRDLHLGPNGELDALTPTVVGGVRTQDEPFDITPPCACELEQILGIARIVDDVVATNDNASIALGPDGLASVERDTTVSLSCGRYALNGISGSARVTLRVSGRVVLAVSGDVVLPPRFSLELEPDAELDWFISGNLALAPNVLIGSERRAAAVRVYVFGSNDITLPGLPEVSMNLYAPQASVTIRAGGAVLGALFAKNVTSSSVLSIRYDTAVVRAEDGCESEPPQSCASCDVCGARSACVAGACAPCTTDSDCCFPLVCGNGVCGPLAAMRN